MITSACPVCGGVETDRLVSAVGARAYCRACFHGWRLDRPAYAYENTAMCPLGTAPMRLAAQIDFFAPFAPPAADILEIGCATGELALAARARLRPARYDGIEVSPARDVAAPRLDRLHARPLPDLLEAGVSLGPYDLIVISHVLEHIDDPGREVRAMRQVLKPGGAICLEVPNGPGHRRLPIDDNRSHLHFFSANSLLRLLAREGLETVAAATDGRLDARYADSLRVIARPYAAPVWSGSLLSDHPALAGETGIVVWGAGNLAEEILANFFDLSRIAYFIDQNPSKQGATFLGKPVRPPASLAGEPRTVLISTIDFADEISAQIDRQCPDVRHRIVRMDALLDDWRAAS